MADMEKNPSWFKIKREENYGSEAFEDRAQDLRNLRKNRKKGTNINKPLKKEAQSKLKDLRNDKVKRQKSPSSSTRERPPPWLKGKQIGLWYRDRRKRQAKLPTVVLNRSMQEKVEDLLISVGIPTSSIQDIQEKFFPENFHDKINVLFEEKLNSVENVEIKPNPELDNKLFNELMTKKTSNKKYENMLEFRKTLPSYGKRKKILEMIENNQVVVISGETGCGKTTQIVQFVLDDYILNHKGSMYNAVCTQPRRISAVSVAERVASERAERLGDSIGYVIRLESEPPRRKRGSITFVTTGILIQWLQSNVSLEGITHLFIDEIHERDMMCDFLITLLKSIIVKRPNLHVILMSATLNAEEFSEYFGGVPCIEIPGFTYPVEELYIEDILKDDKFKYPFLKTNYFCNTIDPVFRNIVVPYVNQLENSGTISKHVAKILRNPVSEKLDVMVLMSVISYICLHEPEGAILVFVPGLVDIQNLWQNLTNNKFFSSSRYIIIPLHSILPTVNQKKAFVKPPMGVRKIVIATSIAETSITIEDIKYVVDSGRIKVKNFDSEKKVSTLGPEWETLANAKQRRGRAGRTQPGKCYKLYTRAREETFSAYPIPEMQRSRLEEVILSAKSLQLGSVAPFLDKVMNPPSSEAVMCSLRMLEKIKVLDEKENLTPLGFHLSKLPLDVQTAKMILMGALFSCADPIFSIAACLNFKDPFVFVFEKQEEILKIKKKFSRGEKSDHFILSQLFCEWEEAEENRQGFDFAFENYLSHSNMQLLRNMKKQFARLLNSMNFLVSDDPKHPISNVNSDNPKLIKAIVCSGLYPNVAAIRNIIKKKKEFSKDRILWKTEDHPKVDLHEKSFLKHVENFESPYIVYFEKVKSSNILLYDATMVSPLTLMFFGERLDIVENEHGYSVFVDNMIQLNCTKRTALLVQKLRDQMMWTLEAAINNPGVVDWRNKIRQIMVLKAIIDLITAEDLTVYEV